MAPRRPRTLPLNDLRCLPCLARRTSKCPRRRLHSNCLPVRGDGDQYRHPGALTARPRPRLHGSRLAACVVSAPVMSRCPSAPNVILSVWCRRQGYTYLEGRGNVTAPAHLPRRRSHDPGLRPWAASEKGASHVSWETMHALEHEHPSSKCAIVFSNPCRRPRYDKVMPSNVPHGRCVLPCLS